VLAASCHKPDDLYNQGHGKAISERTLLDPRPSSLDCVSLVDDPRALDRGVVRIRVRIDFCCCRRHLVSLHASRPVRQRGGEGTSDAGQKREHSNVITRRKLTGPGRSPIRLSPCPSPPATIGGVYTHARQFPHLAGLNDQQIRALARNAMSKRPGYVRLVRAKNAVVIGGMGVGAIALIRWQGSARGRY
jgi:hypothetical protein